MAEKKRKKGNGILFGLVLTGASILAIWKNEHRFDYYKAARDTVPVENVSHLGTGSLFSHTGSMDQGLTLEGRYVQSFQGYLEVDRIAEIYAWDRDEDDDGVSWSKEWMTSLESNDRNKGLNKKFQSDTFQPPTYRISDLTIDSGKTQFVDPSQDISPRDLALTSEGSSQGLVTREDHFYLSKGQSNKIGDERISYRGVPVPAVATYFGKWADGTAVAHQAEVKKGFIADIIQDKGILHHLVAGPRETALVAIKKHLVFVKTITRIVGLVFCTIGGGILFASLTRLLVYIPRIGPFLNQVTGWIGMLVGFLLGLITLIAAYLTSKPIILAVFIVLLITGLVFVARNASRKRKRVQEKVNNTLGHTPTSTEMNELQFILLWQLAASNGAINPDEQRVLDKWTRRNRWSAEKVSELTQRAAQEISNSSDHEKFVTLIGYALADGRIDRKEGKLLQSAGNWAGVGKRGLRNLMSEVQSA